MSPNLNAVMLWLMVAGVAARLWLEDKISGDALLSFGIALLVWAVVSLAARIYAQKRNTTKFPADVLGGRKSGEDGGSVCDGLGPRDRNWTGSTRVSANREPYRVGSEEPVLNRRNIPAGPAAPETKSVPADRGKTEKDTREELTGKVGKLRSGRSEIVNNRSYDPADPDRTADLREPSNKSRSTAAPDWLQAIIAGETDGRFTPVQAHRYLCVDGDDRWLVLILDNEIVVLQEVVDCGRVYDRIDKANETLQLARRRAGELAKRHR